MKKLALLLAWQHDSEMGLVVEGRGVRCQQILQWIGESHCQVL